MRLCVICKSDISNRRGDSKTCSSRCRKRLERENLANRDMSIDAHKKRWQTSHFAACNLQAIRDMSTGSHFRLLDLFCGCGGAAVGYARAGFSVTGVDIAPQKHYPYEFIQADALSLDYEFLLSFDVIHASPPCQQYSRGSVLARKRGKVYPDLFLPVKRMLVASGKPYIIENVVGSPAKGIRLWGDMFGLGVLRERIFESNMPLKCDLPRNKFGSVTTGEYVTVAGRRGATRRWPDAMGIHWADTDGIRQAIPPAYTEFLGKQLHEVLLLMSQLNHVA